MDDKKFISIDNDYLEEPRWPIGKDGIAEDENEYKDLIWNKKDHKKEEPSTLLKITAATVILYKKSLKKLKIAKKNFKKIPMQRKKDFIKGASLALLVAAGINIGVKNVKDKGQREDIRKTRITELEDNNSLDYLINDEPVDLQRVDNTTVAVTDEASQTLDKIDYTSVVIDSSNNDRYKGLLPYGTNPTSEIAREYYNEIINACRNSNIPEDVELRKFLNSFVERTEEQSPEDYNNYITKLIIEITNNRYMPTYNQNMVVVGGKVFEYDDRNEYNSPRR